MKRVARAVLYVLGTVLGLVVLVAVVVFAVSERTLTRTYDAELIPFEAATDSADLQEGLRLARIRGCFGGCHGRTLGGKVFMDEPGVVRITAPNLTDMVRLYSDAELERVVRRGVRRDGRSVFAMPSTMFAGLADEDLARIIGFLRSQPHIDGEPAEFRLGPIGRVAMALGQVRPMAGEIEGQPPRSVPSGDEIEWGRYLVRTSCTECHGLDLRGDPSGAPPDMAIGAAFSEADWERLMRDGVGLGGRQLELMDEIARRRFSHFTDAESRAVHAFLKAMAVDSTLRH